MSSETQVFHRVAAVEEIAPGTGRQVEIEGNVLAVFHLGGEFHATSDMCPHRGASLAEGFLDAGKVFCPWHCFDFNLTTGACEMVPSMRIQTYPVKVENGEVFVAC
jgi:NAD(P)H-dependent nitrite reductase small subunit